MAVIINVAFIHCQAVKDVIFNLLMCAPKHFVADCGVFFPMKMLSWEMQQPLWDHKNSLH